MKRLLRAGILGRRTPLEMLDAVDEHTRATRFGNLSASLPQKDRSTGIPHCQDPTLTSLGL